MFNKTSKPAQISLEELKEDANLVGEEVTYQIRPVEGLKVLEDHAIRFLNRLTSYNHMMTLNE
jgi:hypothetical protein